MRLSVYEGLHCSPQHLYASLLKLCNKLNSGLKLETCEQRLTVRRREYTRLKGLQLSV